MKKFELCVCKKVFKKEDEEVEYYEYSALIDGEKILLQPRDEDKRLLKYLLKFHKYDDKGVMVD